MYLLTRVYEDGKKWSEYAAYLKRTEHTVKNHFNSLIIKQKRATPHIKKEEKLIAEIKSKLSSQNKEEEEGEEGDEGSSGSEGPVLKGEREAELNSKKEQRESNQGDTIRNH